MKSVFGSLGGRDGDATGEGEGDIDAGGVGTKNDAGGVLREATKSRSS
jgi:hypothetical protein